MNSLVIILGIISIFIIYLLFKYLTNTAYTVAPVADFSKSIPTISGDALVSATNLSYAYGIWLYVQNWDSNVDKTIFYRPNNIKLYLDKTSPTLKCDVTLSGGTPSVKTVQITNNFPLQKWVYIIISVDNQFFDCYLDGKLVKSQQVMNIVTDSAGKQTTYTPKQPLDSVSSPLYLGNSGNVGATGTFTSTSGWSANALLFTRWTTPVDPQTAWDWYMKGNGKSMFGNIFGSYGVNYSILKDNIAIVNNKSLF